MLIDTHCHMNMMVKKDFDVPLPTQSWNALQEIVSAAQNNHVSRIINVGTSLVESINCVEIARQFEHVWAAVGIHPNDCTRSWKDDLKEISTLVKNKQLHKIVAIGECGLDKHYPDYDMIRQKDAFKAQIELSLENNLALIVHTRDAADETLRCLEEFKGQVTRGIIHCFSEDDYFAQLVISWGYAVGIGGTLTYPKNHALREIFTQVDLSSVVLETDAPFLPIQSMRGKQNHPQYIKDIAEYLAHLRQEPFDLIAQKTTATAQRIFNIA